MRRRGDAPRRLSDLRRGGIGERGGVKTASRGHGREPGLYAHVVGLADAGCGTVANARESRSLVQQGRFDLVMPGVGIDELVPDPGQIGELRTLSHAPFIILSDPYEDDDDRDQGVDPACQSPTWTRGRTNFSMPVTTGCD